MAKRLKKVDFDKLNQRIPTRWCPDPHRRGRVIPSKKLYSRKPRTPRRGAFDSQTLA
jgi:hypothetical protein